MNDVTSKIKNFLRVYEPGISEACIVRPIKLSSCVNNVPSNTKNLTFLRKCRKNNIYNPIINELQSVGSVYVIVIIIIHDDEFIKKKVVEKSF